MPVHSLNELIALAKAQPGKINFASSGYGAAAHLAGELFKTEAQVDIVHVPYKGAAPALQDVIAGHDQMMFATAASVVGHIKNGKVRALAVTTLKRTAILPDLPTMDEAGLKGFDASTWHGLVAPAGTPPDDHREAARCGGQGAARSGRAGFARPARRRHRRRHAGAIQSLYRGGNSEMDGDRESLRRDDG